MKIDFIYNAIHKKASSQELYGQHNMYFKSNKYSI